MFIFALIVIVHAPWRLLNPYTGCAQLAGLELTADAASLWVLQLPMYMYYKFTICQ